MHLIIFRFYLSCCRFLPSSAEALQSVGYASFRYLVKIRDAAATAAIVRSIMPWSTAVISDAPIVAIVIIFVVIIITSIVIGSIHYKRP